MGDVIPLPGAAEVASAAEDELDLGALLDHQSDLLTRWRYLGEELRRRAEYPLPLDITLELRDLIDETAAL